MTTIRLVTNSPEEYLKALQIYSFFSGIPCGYNGSITPEKFIEKYPYTSGSVVGISDSGNYVTSWYNSKGLKNCLKYSAENIAKVIDSLQSTITIHNVGEYDAVVTKDYVKVGCQTISHDKVKEIARAIDTLKPN